LVIEYFDLGSNFDLIDLLLQFLDGIIKLLQLEASFRFTLLLYFQHSFICLVVNQLIIAFDADQCFLLALFHKQSLR